MPSRQPPETSMGSVRGGKLEIPSFAEIFLSAPIILFMVSACIRVPIGAIFSLETINWRLLYGFGPFTDTARDALSNLVGGKLVI
jgi:hypothetical protein